jgi:type I restriction enzyme S subunit
MLQNNKYLHFVNFTHFNRWDVKSYQFQQIKFNNTVLLSDILIPYNTPISKSEILLNNWSIISKINFAGKLYLREKENAELIKGNLHLVDGDTLIYSKINVRHGCVYFHSANSTPFGVSSEYPAYKLNPQKVTGDYLVLILRSSYFKNALSAKTSGIAKARVKPTEFLSIEIPLPSLTEQKNIVDAYNYAISQANHYAQETDNIDEQIENYLQNKLGFAQVLITQKQTTIGKFIKLFHLKNITRWDVYNSKNNSYSSLYSNQLLRDVLISTPKYGAGYKAEKKQRDVRYIRITDINEDGSLNNDFASVPKFDKQYLLKQNDFLIARTGNTVGKTFLYDDSMGQAIYAGYLIKFELDTNKVNPQYLLAYTKSSAYKQWIKNNMRISAQPNINSKQYEESPIVLPPLDIQNEIVEHIAALRTEQKELHQKALLLRQQATQQFEQTIFN